MRCCAGSVTCRYEMLCRICNLPLWDALQDLYTIRVVQAQPRICSLYMYKCRLYAAQPATWAMTTANHQIGDLYSLQDLDLQLGIDYLPVRRTLCQTLQPKSSRQRYSCFLSVTNQLSALLSCASFLEHPSCPCLSPEYKFCLNHARSLRYRRM